MVESASFREATMDDSMAWPECSEAEELVRELLDDGSGLFILQQIHEANNTIDTARSSSSSSNEQSNKNKLISNIYSGPSISDIQNALSATTQKEHFQQIPAAASVSLLERDFSRIDNKYTLKLKCFGNGMADDGYKWRKYGQKSIKNSPNPRSYYRCTNPRCGAKKQVEKSIEDPETLIITYEGLHLHFAYPYLTSPQQQSNPAAKKPKNDTPQAQAQTQAQDQEVEEVQHAHGGLHIQEAHETLGDIASVMSPTFMGSTLDMGQENMGSQGLLEDMVPLMIRKPASNSGSTSFSCSSYSYSPTPSPSLSWSLF